MEGSPRILGVGRVTDASEQSYRRLLREAVRRATAATKTLARLDRLTRTLLGTEKCVLCGRSFDRVASQAVHRGDGKLICREPCGLRPASYEPVADRQGVVRMRRQE